MTDTTTTPIKRTRRRRGTWPPNFDHANTPVSRSTPRTAGSRKWGGYGANTFFAQCDGRTREAKFLKQVTAELLVHVGPNCTLVQRILVGRAAVLLLRLQQHDRRILADQDFSQIDSHTYTAWQNCLTRVLNTLGLSHLARQPASAGPRLAEILARSRGDGHAA